MEISAQITQRGSSPIIVNEAGLEKLDLTRGQVVTGRVEAVRENGIVQLNLGGKVIEALTSVPLQPNQEVTLQVQGRIEGKLHLRILGLTPQVVNEEAIANSLLRAGVSINEQTTKIAEKLLEFQLPVTAKNVAEVQNSLALQKGSSEFHLRLAVFLVGSGLSRSPEATQILQAFFGNSGDLGQQLGLLGKLFQALSLEGKESGNTLPRNPDTQGLVAREGGNLPSGTSGLGNEGQRSGITQQLLNLLSTLNPGRNPAPSSNLGTQLTTANNTSAHNLEANQGNPVPGEGKAALSSTLGTEGRSGNPNPLGVSQAVNSGNSSGMNPMGSAEQLAGKSGKGSEPAAPIPQDGPNARSLNSEEAALRGTPEARLTESTAQLTAAKLNNAGINPSTLTAVQQMENPVFTSRTLDFQQLVTLFKDLIAEIIPDRSANSEAFTQFLREWPTNSRVLGELLKLIQQQLANSETTRGWTESARQQVRQGLTNTTNELFGQQLLHTVDKSLADRNDFFYFSWPMPPLGKEANGELRVFKRKGAKQEVDPEDCRVVFCFETPNLGKNQFDVQFKRKDLTFRVEVQKEGIQKMLERFWPELDGRLSMLGFNSKLQECRVGNPESLRPELEPLVQVEDVRQIDVKV